MLSQWSIKRKRYLCPTNNGIKYNVFYELNAFFKRLTIPEKLLVLNQFKHRAVAIVDDSHYV